MTKPKERKIEIDDTTPVESAEPSPLKMDNPLVIDGFPFNSWELPKAGRGWDQLKILRDLEPTQKGMIRITAIEGHTDRVPMRRSPSKRFRNLEELSNKRANEVREFLMKAGFKSLPEKNVLKAAIEARESRSASKEKRAKDRKVVIHWQI